MSYSPQDPHAAYLLSMLEEVAEPGPNSPHVGPESLDDAREFLVSLDEHPAKTPATQVERGAALLLEWSKASGRGDCDHAAAVAQKIEHEAAANPLPLRETMKAHIDSNFVQALKPGSSNYRSYGSDLSFGVIAGKLEDDAKVGIVGDWGTGEADARYLLDSMLSQHADIAAILHIGDIYDAGREAEVVNNFKDPISRALSAHHMKIPVFAVPGDHEYMSHGGAAYYWMIGAINDAPWVQQASYFCLRTKSGNWQILGADTGYGSSNIQPGLKAEEVKWHQDKLTNFKGKTLFLTHRQFVSAHDGLDGSFFNNALVNDMKSLMPHIDLFLWGHEHRFLPYIDQLPIPTYQGTLKTKFRTLGGSARHQDEQAQKNPSVVLPTPQNTRNWIGSANGQRNHSYAILDFGASTASYYQVSAWKRGTTNPVRSAPAAPLLVDQL